MAICSFLHGDMFLFVIPGRAEGANPESSIYP